MTDDPKYPLGTKVQFKQGDDLLEGIVNGEEFVVPAIARARPGQLLYVPVHDPQSNENFLVDARNIQ